MRRAASVLVLTALLAAGCLRPPAPVTGASGNASPAASGAGATAAPAEPPASAQPASAQPASVDAIKRDAARPSPAAPKPGAPGDSISTADVTRETARMFGTEAPPPPTDTMAAPGAPVWDIDVRSYETRKRVADYVQIFSGRAKDVFAIALQRQTRYGPMVRERLKRIGLPEDLSYLALVESWFDPHAYSRAAAVGMWQFMAGTARGMGLRVDWWMDERRDPVRSTDAAARLLLGLRQQFGSLYLAAAAYNGGSGRVSRGLARYADALDGIDGEDRFFALAEKSYLRPETRNYVPKIIAAALVGGEPARYGVRVESLPPYAYDSVRTPGGTPLAAVANALGLSPQDVSELNPHILRGMTPPSDSMWVRVPAGRAVNFEERFSALEPDERRALTRIESKKGQTMLSIAKKYDLTQKQLGWYNPKVTKLKSGALRSGQIILVPRRDVAALARDVPNPSVERYPRRSSGVKRHRVASGETLSGIAKKYGVSVKTLVRLNGLKSATVMPGQSLVVSGRASSGSAKPAAKAAARPSAKPSSAAKKKPAR
jgi:membrane-bound lytic murein transglycosylase D